MAEPTKVDFDALGKPVIVDDMRKDENKLDMDHQSDVVHAALTAVQGINMPHGALHAGMYNDGKEIMISKDIDSFIKSSASRITLQDQNIELDHADIHSVSARIYVLPQPDGSMRVNFRASHGGAYDENTIDQTVASISLTFDAQGHVTNRTGGASSEAIGANPNSQTHGRWAIQAAQTLESNFAKIMGGEVEIEINKFRSETAATKADAPPVAENAAMLSSVNFASLTDDAAPTRAAPIAAPRN